MPVGYDNGKVKTTGSTGGLDFGNFVLLFEGINGIIKSNDETGMLLLEGIRGRFPLFPMENGDVGSNVERKRRYD